MTLHLRVHSEEFRVESASGSFVRVTIMSICNNTLLSRVKRYIVLSSTILDIWVKDQQLQTPLNNFGRDLDGWLTEDNTNNLYR